jgi:hypothetical protein
VQLRTPTPVALPEVPWEAKTPSNIRELEAQSTLIRDRIQRHKSFSPASIIQAIGQLKKGAEVMMLSAELMRYGSLALREPTKQQASVGSAKRSGYRSAVP